MKTEEQVRAFRELLRKAGDQRRCEHRTPGGDPCLGCQVDGQFNNLAIDTLGWVLGESTDIDRAEERAAAFVARLPGVPG